MPIMRQPPFSKRCRNSGWAVTLAKPARSFSSTGAGVLAEAKIPIQLSISKPSTPASRAVGICGMDNSRRVPDVAKGLMRPASIKG